jgi:hypothetical protein
MRLSTSEPQRRNNDFEFDDEVNTKQTADAMRAPSELTGFYGCHPR